MEEKRIYSSGHSSYIKLSAILDIHGLIGDNEDKLIQDILNTFNVPENVNKFDDHGIDTIGDENW